ncbi:hypothetical protein ABIB90_001709 [Bradyrhizobium sp. JR4.1]
MKQCGRRVAAIAIYTVRPAPDGHSQGVTKAGPAGVESGDRRGIPECDIVEYEDVGGTFRIAPVFLIHGCGRPAHAGLDLRDQLAKVSRNQLTAIDFGHCDERRRSGQI